MLLSLDNITKRYPRSAGMLGRRQPFAAVDDVSFVLERGRTLGIVGESGSGKSTMARISLGFERPDEGDVVFDGLPLPKPNTAPWRALRPQMQMVYQDPLAAMDRRMSVRQIVAEPLVIHRIGEACDRKDRVEELLHSVGLRRDQADLKPRELSGGQRQRVVLARALATRPRLLVCDEPVSALDVSIQAQIVNLLCDLREEHGLSMLFISHDLRVVRHVSDEILVIYFGRVVERGHASEIIDAPLHPYTRLLVDAMPAIDRRMATTVAADDGVVSSPPSGGCPFRSRCRLSIARCHTDRPTLRAVDATRSVACHVVGNN